MKLNKVAEGRHVGLRREQTRLASRGPTAVVGYAALTHTALLHNTSALNSIFPVVDSK